LVATTGEFSLLYESRVFQRGLIPYLRFFAAWVVLANLPFWLAPYFFDVRIRGYFNVEYILIGLIWLAARRIPKPFIFLLLYASCFIDILVTSSQLFYFATNDLRVASTYITQLPLTRVLTVFLSLSALAMVWTAFLLKVSPKPGEVRVIRIGAAMLALVFVFVGLDIVRGDNTTLSSRDSIPSVKISSASLTGFIKMIPNLGRVTRAQVPPAESATSALLKDLRQDNRGLPNSGVPRNIALILVESYGALRDATQASLISAPFNTPAIRRHYDVTGGTVPFHGTTIAGEFRELCGVAASIAVHPDDFSTCLPALLKQRGYETISFHGFKESMFARDRWYPLMGFDKSMFVEQMERLPGANICGGVFPGICDSDVARLAGDYLANNSSRQNFVYWVTLNSHLPVLRSLANDGPFGCGTDHAEVQDADLCMWMSLVYKVQSSIAAMAVRPDLPPTEFYIVGDHAPPFILSERRNMFSPGVVPYLHLFPHS
jgi:hypothetical protein